MKKWLRWQGLLMFLLVLGGLLSVAYWYAEPTLKRVIESVGSRALGAKVEVAAVDISWSPLGVTLHHIQATDPNEPMTNLIEIGRFQMAVDLLPLWLEKVVVDNATLADLKFGSERQTSGALPKGDSAEAATGAISEDDEWTMPKVEMPNLEELMAGQQFETLQQADQFRTRLKEVEQRWKGLQDQLPDKAQLEGYKQRVKKLEDAKSPLEKLMGLKELDDVRKDIKKDLAKIKEVKQIISDDWKTLKADFKALKRAPGADVDQAMAKLGLADGGGWKGFGRAMLGPTYQGYLDRALHWYQRLSPYAEKAIEAAAQKEASDTPPRGEGVDIAFREYQPVPEFWLKKAKLSGQLQLQQQGLVEFSGDVVNATNQPKVLGRATQVDMVGQGKTIEKIDLQLTLDHTQEIAADSAKLVVTNIQVQQWPLSESSDLPLLLESALLSIDSEGQVVGEQLQMTANSQFVQTQFQTPGLSDPNGIQRAVGRALTAVDAFQLTLTAEGDVLTPSVSMQSDLDQVFKQAAGAELERAKTRLKGRVQDKLQAMLDEKLQGVDADWGQLQNMDGDLTKQMEALSKLL